MVVVEEVPIAPIKLAVSQLGQKSLPEGTFAYPVTLDNLRTAAAEGQGLPLQGRVERPVRGLPGALVSQRGIPDEEENI